jgi:cytoskeletal protein CcmA (bactofilin family)
MASNLSVIGRTTRVRGRVTGATDLEVQGFVDGEISVSGDVTVDAHGLVGAGVRGRRLVVRGAVKGDLSADEAILLEDGARVVGDVRAPRVAIAPGALVRGFVETIGEAPALARPARTAAAAAPRTASAFAARPASAVVSGSPRTMPAVASAAGTPAPGNAAALRVSGQGAVAPAAAAASAGSATGAAAGGAGHTTNATAAKSGTANLSPRRPPPPNVAARQKGTGQNSK